jgi:hypothetical protein
LAIAPKHPVICSNGGWPVGKTLYVCKLVNSKI